MGIFKEIVVFHVGFVPIRVHFAQKQSCFKSRIYSMRQYTLCLFSSLRRSPMKMFSSERSNLFKIVADCWPIPVRAWRKSQWPQTEKVREKKGHTVWNLVINLFMWQALNLSKSGVRINLGEFFSKVIWNNFEKWENTLHMLFSR